MPQCHRNIQYTIYCGTMQYSGLILLMKVREWTEGACYMLALYANGVSDTLTAIILEIDVNDLRFLLSHLVNPDRNTER